MEMSGANWNFNRQELERRLIQALRTDVADPEQPVLVGETAYLRAINASPRYSDLPPEKRRRIARNFAIRDEVTVIYRSELAGGLFPFYMKRAIQHA